MEQTILETSEKYTETEISQSSRSLNDVCVQTDSHEGIDMDTQTRAQPRNDQQTMTHNPEFTVILDFRLSNDKMTKLIFRKK